MRINSTFGLCVLIVIAVIGGLWGWRVYYLTLPPSDTAVAIARSLRERPDEWKMGSVELVLVNKERGLTIYQFAGTGSLQVTKDRELVPTLEKNMNMISSRNQHHVAAAIKEWTKSTAEERSNRMVAEISYAK